MVAKRGLVLLVLLSCSFALVASRVLQEFESNKEGPVSIRAELIHRNHPESRLPRRQLADHVGVQFGTRLSAASLYGDWAEYAMTIYLGTPVQKFVLIVDTGSDLLWVQCKPCIQCYNQTNPVFDPAASASYSTADCENCDSRLFNGGARCNRLVRTCTIGYRYGMPGSSIRGLLATENISFSNDSTRLAVSELLFGCMDNNTASFGALDGLVGMGRGVLSLPSQLRQLTSFDAFSYCLVPFSVSSLLTSPVLFGANTSLELVYTPILENPDVLTWYWVNMTGVTVGGVAVNVSAAALQWNRSSFSGGTIFDSGTSLLVLLEEVFTPVVQSLRALITYPVVPAADSVCYNMSGILLPVFPSVSLQFSGANGAVEFPLGAKNLFVPNSTADVTVQCLAVVPAGAQAIGPNIIGNIAQADHYIETDLENMRIGWTSRDCSLPL